MKQILLYILITLVLSGCNFPANLPLSEKEKPADNFARHFFDNLLQGQTDSCFANMWPESQSSAMKGILDSSSKNLAGYTIKKYNVVENKANYVISTRVGKTASYLLGYEYQLEKESNPLTIIFRTSFYEKEGVFYMVNFAGKPVTSSLVESSGFTLTGKTFIHYAFLACIILSLHLY